MRIFIAFCMLLALFQTVLAKNANSENSMAEYKIQAGESLMQVAYRIYGDYRKWKYLVSLNSNLKEPEYSLEGLEKINYIPPTKLFVWNPLGEPYLVKKGETLGTISTKLYGTSTRWEELYDNNRPMIRWPNLIFEGFTIYYITDPT